MAPQAIQTAMQRLENAGLCLTLTAEKGIKVSPASAMTDTLRALIIANKVEIVAYLSDAANDPAPDTAPDPDRQCRPQSAAINTAETDLFTPRLARLSDRGLIQSDAECLAARLLIRDREQDDRAMCLECNHLHRAGRCTNSQRAGIAIHAWDAQLAPEFMHLLQRCDGFKGV